MFKPLKLTLILKGVLIGIGIIIPGVSAGALSLALGLYENLFYSLNAVTGPQTLITLRAWFKRDASAKTDIKILKKNLLLLSIVSLGILIGIFAFSQFITYAIEVYPKPTFFFFMGLMIGSLPAVYRAHDSFSFSLSHAVAGSLGFFIMILLSFIPQGPQLELTAGASLSLIQISVLVLSGAVAAAGMIVPGISGSVLLLLMGTYYHLLAAISQFNMPVLLAVGVGLGLGFIFFTKLIYAILQRYPIFTAYLIMGLVVGSMVKLWPGFSYDLWGALCVASGLIGIIIGKRLG